MIRGILLCRSKKKGDLGERIDFRQQDPKALRWSVAIPENRSALEGIDPPIVAQRNLGCSTNLFEIPNTTRTFVAGSRAEKQQFIHMR